MTPHAGHSKAVGLMKARAYPMWFAVSAGESNVIAKVVTGSAVTAKKLWESDFEHMSGYHGGHLKCFKSNPSKVPLSPQNAGLRI